MGNPADCECIHYPQAPEPTCPVHGHQATDLYDEIDYVQLEHDLEELEASDANVAKARDDYERAKQQLLRLWKGQTAMYTYRAFVLRVVDADTLWLDADLGFDVRRKDTFRLYGVDAPERNTPEGDAATQWLKEELYAYGALPEMTGQRAVVITTHKDRRERYGRYLATLWLGPRNINEEMIAAGHARPYEGR